MTSPVFAVFEVRINGEASPEAQRSYEEYRAAVPALIARFGGRYLVRAALPESLEGVPSDGKWHLVEFPDRESALAFWACDEYRALTPLRAGAAEVRAVLLGG
jgi:uncharacterized protein (DUF1330 family)